MTDNITAPDRDVTRISVDNAPWSDFAPYGGFGMPAAFGGYSPEENLAPNLSPQAKPSAVDSLQHDLAGKTQEHLDKQTALDASADRQLDIDRANMDAAFRLEAASAHDPALRPWNADEERAARTHGPMEQFGSLGMIFAVAASAFTRHPMTSALNAGAAAMTAIQAGDEKAYKSAYEAWKSNTDLALKRFDMERALYDDANKLATTDMAMWKEKTLMLATQFGDQKKIAMLNAGLDTEVLQAQETQAKTIEGLRESTRKQEMFEIGRQVYAGKLKEYQREHPGEDDDHPTSGWVQAKAKAFVEWNAMMKGQSLDQKFEQMMALEMLRQQGRTDLEGRKQEGRTDLEGKKQEGRERLEAEKQEGRERLEDAKQEHALDRLRISGEARKQLAQMNIDARLEITELLEGGREERAEMSANLRRELAKLNSEDRKYVQEQINKRSTDKPLSMSASDAAEVARRTANFESDPDSPTYGKHDESRDRAAEQVLSAHRSKKEEAKPSLSEGAAKMIAEQINRGDRTGLQGLGYGTVGAANRALVYNTAQKLAEEQGLNSEELSKRKIEWQALATGARSLENREATMIAAITKAQQTAPRVLEASAKIDRTRFSSINAMEQAVKKGTGDENIIRLIDAVETFRSNYAAALGQGQTAITDDARKRASSLLETYWSKGQIATAIDQLRIEMQSELRGIRQGMSVYMDRAPEPKSTEANDGRPDGFRYKKDGWIWEKRNGRRVPLYEL